MSQLTTNGYARTWPDPKDPFFYGWRDVLREGPDGSTWLDRVPLTADDVLHPQEGDHIMNGPDHDVECAYLRSVCSSQVADDPDARVFYDVGVFWDNPALRHHSPDITVIQGVPGIRDLTDMYHVADHGGVRPTLLIEVVSPSTRSTDLGKKVKQYHQAGVQLYVIVDRPRLGSPPRLIGYRYEPAGYVETPLDDRGWLWLAPVRVWLGTVENRVVCYDAAGNELGDYVAVSRELAQAKAQADAERQRADAERLRAEAAEQRLRELEQELRQLRGG